jgi:hypothetical protein
VGGVRDCFDVTVFWRVFGDLADVMLLFEEAEVGSLIAGVFVAGVRGVFGTGTFCAGAGAGGLAGDTGLGVTDSGSISTGLGRSFLQFSRYVLSSS